MKTHDEITQVLKSCIESIPIQLREQSEITKRELDDALRDQEEFKVSTLLSLIDRLGLELILVPKSSEPLVKSRVQAALDRINRLRQKNK